MLCSVFINDNWMAILKNLFEKEKIFVPRKFSNMWYVVGYIHIIPLIHAHDPENRAYNYVFTKFHHIRTAMIQRFLTSYIMEIYILI